MHADEHAGAMCMTKTMMRPGLFLQREGPGSEPGNSLVCPDEAQACGTGGNYPHASRAGCGHERWGGVGKQQLLFAIRIVRCFSSLGHLNDCECTNTLAQKLGYMYM